MDDDALLDLVYRGRPATVADLVALSHLPSPDVRAAVARLEERGLVARHDDRLTYPHPVQWITDAVSAELAGIRRRADSSIAQVEDLVAALPDLLRQWSVGETASELVPVVIRHGPRAAEDLWYDTARHVGGTAEAVYPDVTRFLTTDRERAERFARAFAGKSAVRAIVPTAVRDEPRLMALLTGWADAGVQFRALDDPPSWFWVDDDMLAVPFEWGEGWPTSVLSVRNEALAHVARTLFDELWRRGERLEANVRTWTPLLRLMRQGHTLDASSRMLGINPRTGRRRVAAAMEHYGVSTLFALGVAWAPDSDE
jgi:hypothetical protein